jgi:peptide/nickel transport system substrate-binding protein
VRSARRIAALVVAAMGAAVGIGGFGAAGGAAEPVRLTVGVIGPIGSLDPATANRDVARETWQLQYPTLTTFALDPLDVVPGLARAWSPTADGRGFVYTLQSATWSDGRPITAADVVASLRNARDGNWPYAENLLVGLDAHAIDDTTVEVDASAGLGALPTLPLHIFPGGTPADGVSGGDFRVVDHSDARVTMDVVDRPGRAALDQVVFRSYPDADSLRTALERGDVDIAAGFAPRDYDTVRDTPHATTVHANDGAQWLLDSRVDDPVLRGAIAHAIDRDALVHDVVNDVGRAATTPLFARPAEWQLPDTEAQQIATANAYEPEAARAAVATLPGAPQLTIAAPDSAAGNAIAHDLIASLGDAGITVRRVAGDTGDLEVVRRDPSDDPTAALQSFTCGAGKHCDPAYDAAFASFTTADAAGRRAAAQEMTRLLGRDGTEVALFTPDELQAFRTDNIDGMLRTPEQTRLVVFWPSVEQYRQMTKAAPAAAEELPATTYLGLAVGVGLVAVLVIFVLDRVIQARRKTEQAKALSATNG